jgi:hypothetical protein
MANELLDFVMSLVRDPDAAARYAENPDQAIHDANLVNVTSADVSNLIPVVSESLSAGVPTTGIDHADAGSNVWTSGAATAAFDAFGDHLPAATVDDAHSVITDHLGQLDPALHSGLDAVPDADLPSVVGGDEAPLHLDQPLIDDAPLVDDHPLTDVDHHIADVDHHIVEVSDMDSDPSGFDLF